MSCLLHSEDLLYLRFHTQWGYYSLETVNHLLPNSPNLLHYQFHSYNYLLNYINLYNLSKLSTIQGVLACSGMFNMGNPTANWPRQPQNKPRTQKSKAKHHLLGLDWIRLDAIHHHIGFSNIGFYQKISIKRKCFMVPETTHGDRKNWI